MELAAHNQISEIPPAVLGGSDRIRLLEFITFFYLGGTERQMVNLTKGLAPEHFQVHLGCFGKVGPFLEDVTSLGIPVSEYKTGSLSSLGSWLARLRLARYLRDHSVDIVHSYGFYSNVFAIPAARLARVPVVIASIRDCGETLTPMQKRVQRMFCQMADCILANAEGVRTWLLAEGYPAGKIEVIRNGIALAPPVKAEPASGLRQELGLPADTPLVAVLSRLNPMKGIEYFLEAAAIVLRRVPAARFLIIGGGSYRADGSYKAEIEKFAADLGLFGRVIFTGFRTDVPEILTQINISVLPSLSEGLSNSLLESMAAAVPTIAT
jgi:glycosyltransferase involved in cell wall biosynthesis